LLLQRRPQIDPATFGRWMAILRRAPGSVLWLLPDSDATLATLRAEAVRHGIEPARLIAAPRTDPQAHVSRGALADLFLDTFICNAHTTASDALWSGLPVLTCPGETFASRVAAGWSAPLDSPSWSAIHRTITKTPPWPWPTTPPAWPRCANN
jgi:predicted O-linked N-acetylglucosamine transferase (SPINDLY family)